MSLPPKQQRFVEEYLVDFNATAAAKRAGYAAQNADVTGPRLLGNVGIQQAIRLAMAATAAKAELTREEVIKGLRWEAAQRGEGAIAGPRVKALELLGKTLGMFPDKVQFDGRMKSDVNHTVSLDPVAEAERIAAAVAGRRAQCVPHGGNGAAKPVDPP
jgi:phage terminase small subunit